MTGLETATLIVATLNNPLVQLGMSGAIAIGGALVAYLVQTQPKAADIAQDVADLDAEIGPWVASVEKLLTPNSNKYATVEKQAHDWLTEHGITGRKGALAKKYLPILIEKAVALQPKPMT